MKKRVICIDESGGFESKEPHARFLGGCVFTGNPAAEEISLKGVFEELAREVTRDYRQKFQGCEFRFPYSFHMSKLTVFDTENRSVQVDDDRTLKEIRGKILNRVKGYLSERKREYQLFALVVPFQNTVGYEESGDIRNFDLTDFRNPGVLYERLITGLVHNFTFYSLDSDVEKNIFKIAARTPTLPKSGLTQEEIQKLRDINDVWIDSRQQLHLTQTNINTFRASLSEKIFERGAVNGLAITKLEIDCKSIDYSGSGVPQISPFFYLADILCYYLQRLFYGEGSNAYYENFQMNHAALQRVKKECVVPCFFWAYEEADSLLKQAIEAYAAGRLAECFSALYDMEHAKGQCMEYYKQHWEAKLLHAVTEAYEHKQNPDYLKRIPEELAYAEQFMQKGQSDYPKAEFVLKNLEKIILNGKYCLEREQDYQMQDMFLRIHNHHGSVETSRKYFRKLLSLSDAVSMETFITSVNRAAQIYFNQFAYEPLVTLYEFLLDDAEKVKESYSIQRDMTAQLIQEIFGEKKGAKEGKNQLEWIGKMYSSLGQAYAYQRNYEKAIASFNRAISEFQTEENKRITKGYLLHALIDSGSDKAGEAFQESAGDALGADDTGTQLNLIINNKDGVVGNSRFHLYLWVKAVYTFGLYKNGAVRRAVKKLVGFVQSGIKEAESKYQIHPWELIYKYLYLLCRDIQDGELNEKAAFFAGQCRKKWPEAEETIFVIREFIMYQLETEPEKKQYFMERIEGMSDGIEGLRGLKKAEDKEKFLKNRLTYMYN